MFCSPETYTMADGSCNFIQVPIFYSLCYSESVGFGGFSVCHYVAFKKAIVFFIIFPYP